MNVYLIRSVVAALVVLTAPVLASAQTQAPSPIPGLDMAKIYGYVANAAAAGIQTAHDDSIKLGVQPIPPAIRQKLIADFPAELLDRVRYRVAQEGTYGLQVFQYGEIQAMTLIDVVIFRNEQDALNSDVLWAHELTHVRQYDRWGLDEFARRYVNDHTSVENEAYGFQAEYEKRKTAAK